MPFDEKLTPYDGYKRKYTIVYAVEEQYAQTVSANTMEQAIANFMDKSQTPNLFDKSQKVQENYKVISCKPTN